MRLLLGLKTVGNNFEVGRRSHEKKKDIDRRGSVIEC